MQFFEDIKIITLFSLVFFALFLFNYKKGNRMSNMMLAAIYAFQGLEMLNGTFYRFADFWVNKFPWVFYSTEITFFLWGPAIYFFIRFSIDSNHTFQKRDLWHLAPAIVHTLFLCYVFHFNTNEAKTFLLQKGVMTPLEDIVIHSLRNTAVVVYLTLGTFLFKKSTLDNEDKKHWFVFFLIVFWIVEIIQILHFVDLETRIYNTIIYNTTSLVWFSVSIITLYKALRDPFFFANEKLEIPKLNVEERKDKLQLLDDEYELILKAINEEIIKKELFVNPDLNLKVLASTIGYSSSKVSFVVNDHYKNNISDFINSFRVAKAKQLLLDKEDSEKTIIEIAFEVGFNSKATFNRAFSKFVEVSPTEFRNGGK